MNLEVEFKKSVRTYLEPLGVLLLPVLQKLIQHKYPSEVKCLYFEIFADSFTTGFPVRAFFMDSDNCEFFVKDSEGKPHYPSPVDPDLLEIEQVFSENYEEYFEDKDEDLDTYTLASEELVSWFSECWNKAMVEGFHLNAIISMHDSNNEFDLIKQKWCDK